MEQSDLLLRADQWHIAKSKSYETTALVCDLVLALRLLRAERDDAIKELALIKKSAKVMRMEDAIGLHPESETQKRLRNFEAIASLKMEQQALAADLRRGQAAQVALVARWRDTAAWEDEHGSPEFGKGLDQCANELAALIPPAPAPEPNTE